MPPLATVSIHSSQFPDQVQRDLLESLRARELNHKFLYDGVKQTQKWLALHQACSPSRTDPDCAAIYDQGFREAATRLSVSKIHLVGLGCGGGQKDTRCLQLLVQAGKHVAYTPADVSAAMVLTARGCALAAIPGLPCNPLVCDLATATDLESALSTLAPARCQRLVTFFGIIPNLEPDIILPRLASLLRPRDVLLFSANLAPGPDYGAGIRQLLPLYDNEPTRQWLLSFLQDLGVDRADGELQFGVEQGQAGLKRIVARFHFKRSREIGLENEIFHFASGEGIRVFFSYRHTATLVHGLLSEQGLEITAEWITSNGEEGVFLVRRKR